MTRVTRARQIAAFWRSVATEVKGIIAAFESEWNEEACATRSQADWLDSEEKAVGKIKTVLVRLGDGVFPTWFPCDMSDVDAGPLHMDTAEKTADDLEAKAKELEEWASEKEK